MPGGFVEKSAWQEQWPGLFGGHRRKRFIVMVTLLHGPHQEVCEESDHQQRNHAVHGGVVQAWRQVDRAAGSISISWQWSQCGGHELIKLRTARRPFRKRLRVIWRQYPDRAVDDISRNEVIAAGPRTPAVNHAVRSRP